MLDGSIERGGGSLNQQIPRVATEFGVHWVHLVAHSKGGLNSRYLIGTGWLEYQGVGVLSLITLDTPHEGSVGGDAVHALTEWDGHAWTQIGEPEFGTMVMNGVMRQRIQNEIRYGSMSDMGTESMKKWNQDHTLPTSMTVNGVKKHLWLYALVSDANPDNSPTNRSDTKNPAGQIMYYQREIDDREARAWPSGGFKGSLVGGSAGILQAMYNMMGTTSGVATRTRPAPARPLVVPVLRASGFLLNDGVVEIGSQAYISGGALVSSPTTEPHWRPTFDRLSPGPSIYGSNHTAVADATVADWIIAKLTAVSRLRGE